MKLTTKGEARPRRRPAEDVGGSPAEGRSRPVACGVSEVAVEWSRARRSRGQRQWLNGGHRSEGKLAGVLSALAGEEGEGHDLYGGKWCPR